ncbi:hypothetical protein EB796_009977 [Bugula neritina]|uniref:CCHC-type domain-containing protein n=1 Tax=Bugula neritina TaxID=10212 RepID=A0A7J7K0G1_BUGNE|nr:hypothetical protein EB796_009977 [Bugula neritina]
MEGITPPAQLDIRADDLSGVWRRWVRSFNDYLLAIDLAGTSKVAERRKLALFRHVGGEDVRELYSQMEFLSTPDDNGTITELEEGTEGRRLVDVINRFQDYCNPRSGVVVTRHRFHSCAQNGDTVDVYLMKLRQLAEGCEFGSQRDSLIRDKLLFGLDDTKEMEKLMRETDEKLTLDFVIRALRVAEKSGNLKSKSTALKPQDVEAIQISANPGIKKVSQVKQHQSRVVSQFRPDQARPIEKPKRSSCSNCGRNHPQNRRCPAYGTQCKNCKEYNHWELRCPKKIYEVEEHNVMDSDYDVYLGEVSSINSVEGDSWFADITGLLSVFVDPVTVQVM